MIFDDAADDRKSQAGAAPLGGEIGQEEFFFDFRSDAVTGIGDTISTESRSSISAVEMTISFIMESCMASAALSTRLATARLMASGSACTRGKSAARNALYRGCRRAGHRTSARLG